jgi:hypothetical protein
MREISGSVSFISHISFQHIITYRICKIIVLYIYINEAGNSRLHFFCQNRKIKMYQTVIYYLYYGSERYFFLREGGAETPPPPNREPRTTFAPKRGNKRTEKLLNKELKNLYWSAYTGCGKLTSFFIRSNQEEWYG